MRWKPLAILVLGVAVLPAYASAQTPAAEETPSAQTAQPISEVHPTPAHTGWATLGKDTVSDFVSFPKRKSTWVLLGMGAAGALITRPADHYVERHIVGNGGVTNTFKPGKWVGAVHTQVGTAVGLWALGRYVFAPAADEPRTNRMSHLGFDLIRAQIVSQALVQGIKHAGQRKRPGGECCSFPSGHAASAFAAAAVLERHLGYRGSWPALAGAAYVATSRLVEGRHFLSDVMFGAALGTASGWTVVGRHGRRQYALYPVPVQGGIMFTLARVEE